MQRLQNKIHNRTADNIRILSAAMVEKAKSGHPGGAMGGAFYVSKRADITSDLRNTLNKDYAAKKKAVKTETSEPKA